MWQTLRMALTSNRRPSINDLAYAGTSRTCHRAPTSTKEIIWYRKKSHHSCMDIDGTQTIRLWLNQ